MQILELNNAELEQKWRDYLNKKNDGNIYQTLEWRNLLKEEYGFQAKYLIALDENKNTIGIFPLFLIKNFTGKKLVSLPCSQIAGPLTENDEIVKKFLNFILEKQKAWGYKKIVIKFDKKIDFETPGFEKRNEHIICSLDTSQNLDKLKKNFSRNKKRSYKKATEYGLNIRKHRSIKDLESIYNLELQLRKRQGVPIFSFDYFKKMHQIFEPLGQLVTLLAEDKNNEIITAETFFIYNNSAFNGYSVTHNPKFNHISPITLVQWKQIEYCCQNEEIEQLSFGVTDVSAKGILEYKQKWGSSTAETTSLYYPKSSKVTSISKQGKIYDLFLLSQKLIPTPIFKRIGKYIIKHFA